jgi:hypothetical protein
MQNKEHATTIHDGRALHFVSPFQNRLYNRLSLAGANQRYGSPPFTALNFETVRSLSSLFNTQPQTT